MQGQQCLGLRADISRKAISEKQGGPQKWKKRGYQASRNMLGFKGDPMAVCIKNILLI